mgnify:CR=1 FL=1
MIIVVQNEFPVQSAKEVGKCFAKLPPLPDYLTLGGPYLKTSMEGGVRSISLYICDNAHISEGLLAVNNRMTAYFDVPGFSCSCEVWMQAPEALKMVGLG